MSTPVVTRIAPSPTGLFHIGTARTVLFNYLYAKHHGGHFAVRIEDTDKVRSTKESEENILAGIQALGLQWDSFTRQSEHLARHVACLQKLIEEGKAYVSREPAKDDASREVAVVRLRNPGKTITFHDEIRGDITFDTAELGDIVIARSLEDPLYHFAVVVDDADLGTTLILRGEEHISNTPRQILIQEALGFARPMYAHLPLILSPDRSKMSKRKGDTVAVSQYLQDGFLPEALVNYLALLGWNPGTEQEVYSLEELVRDFSLEGIQKSGAIFDTEKLKWYNKEHRAKQDQKVVAEELLAYLADFPDVQTVLARSPKAQADMLERYATYRDSKEAIEQGEFDFYRTRPVVSKDMLAWKKDPNPERAQERLQKIVELLTVVAEKDWSYDAVKEAVWAYAEAEGRGAVLWPLRMALSGKERSPDPFVLAEGLGKEEVMARLESAVQLF